MMPFVPKMTVAKMNLIYEFFMPFPPLYRVMLHMCIVAKNREKGELIFLYT